MPRKRNFLRVPAWVQDKVDVLPSDDVVVAVVRRITPDQARNGEWDHLQLAVNDDGAVVASGPVIPAAERGRFSRANLFGYERVRRDLPKIEKTFSVETPNWGDWSRGSHIASWTRMVYQRELFPPNHVAIRVEVLSGSVDMAEIKFSVDRVLDRSAESFQKDLFYDLNLLQENVGAVDVFPASASRADYLQTVGVHWELLPPGTVDETVERVSRALDATPAERATVRERLEVLVGLAPQNFVTGTSGFQRYFGAQFGDDLVIFENLRYGNAAYAMYQDWEQLSRLSRIELLNGSPEGFDRVIHRRGWEHRIRGIVDTYRRRVP